MAPTEPARPHATVNGVDYAYLEAGVRARSRCASTASPTPRAAGRRCSASSPTPASTPSPRSCAATRPTAAPADGLAPLGALGRRRPRAARRSSAATSDACSSATTGARSPPTAQRRPRPTRWRRIVTASIPPSAVMATRLLDYDQLKMFWYQYVFLQPTAEAHRRRTTTSSSSPACGPTGRRASTRSAALARREGRAARPGQPHRRAQHLPLRVRLRPRRTRVRRARAGPVHAPHPADAVPARRRGRLRPRRSVVEPARAALPEGSRAELIVGAGHFLQYEQPDVVNRLIVDFVTG